MDDGRRIAVVDLGTNSTRLLVADVDRNGTVDEIERRTDVTRLGEGVDTAGRLTDEAMERVFSRLEDYRKLADERDAERSIAVATSAVRDASNGEEFQEAVRERYGFDIRTISGDEEARLTFLGATSGRDPAEGPTLVIDIGGGSTEYVVGSPGEAPGFHVSTRMGSVRFTERHLASDPPLAGEMAAVSEAARETVEADVPADVRDGVKQGIAVAGTATSLAAVDQELEPYDPLRVHGYHLSAEACDRMLAMLAALPVLARRNVPGLHPDRAPTIVAGVAILVESMRAFGLERIETSEADILHGAALDDALYRGENEGEEG